MNSLAECPAHLLKRLPFLGCHWRDRDKVHRVYAPNNWGGLQRFARPAPASEQPSGIETASTCAGFLLSLDLLASGR